MLCILQIARYICTLQLRYVAIDSTLTFFKDSSALFTFSLLWSWLNINIFYLSSYSYVHAFASYVYINTKFSYNTVSIKICAIIIMSPFHTFTSLLRYPEYAVLFAFYQSRKGTFWQQLCYEIIKFSQVCRVIMKSRYIITRPFFPGSF